MSRSWKCAILCLLESPEDSKKVVLSLEENALLVSVCLTEKRQDT